MWKSFHRTYHQRNSRFETWSGITSEENSGIQLFVPFFLANTILKNTVSEYESVSANDCNGIDDIDLFACIGLQPIDGVFRSHDKTIECLWDSEKGRLVFGAAMSLKTFKKIIKSDKV